MGKVSVEWLRRMRNWLDGDLRAAPPEDAGRVAMVEAYDELLAFREGYDPAERLPEDGQLCAIHYQWPGTDKSDWAVEIGPILGIPPSWVIRWYPIGGEVRP